MFEAVFAQRRGLARTIMSVRFDIEDEIDAPEVETRYESYDFVDIWLSASAIAIFTSNLFRPRPSAYLSRCDGRYAQKFLSSVRY